MVYNNVSSDTSSTRMANVWAVSQSGRRISSRLVVNLLRQKLLICPRLPRSYHSLSEPSRRRYRHMFETMRIRAHLSLFLGHSCKRVRRALNRPFLVNLSIGTTNRQHPTNSPCKLYWQWARSGFSRGRGMRYHSSQVTTVHHCCSWMLKTWARFHRTSLTTSGIASKRCCLS